MDPNYITPFIRSIQNVFTTMLQLDVKVDSDGDRNAYADIYSDRDRDREHDSDDAQNNGKSLM